MARVSLTALGIICEALGVLLILPTYSGMGGALPGCLLFHLAGCLLMAGGAATLLPAGLGGGKWRGPAVFTFTFFIPLFGTLGILLILLYFRFAGTRGLIPEFFSIPQLPLSSIEGVRPVRMGEGGAWSRLREESIPRMVKLEAIMAAGMAPGQNASHLLRIATSDVDDEIRLVAFHLFEKREKKINESINHLLSALKESTLDGEKGDICTKLAFAYWEFVYNDMVRLELKEFYLDQALYYARRAESLLGERHYISALMGRIQLRRGNIDEAEQAADRALELGALPEKVVPFKAEILYLRRDFDELKRLLGEYAHLRHKPGIGSVVSFWSGA